VGVIFGLHPKITPTSTIHPRDSKTLTDVTLGAILASNSMGVRVVKVL
jgi:hypothetical protein